MSPTLENVVEPAGDVMEQEALTNGAKEAESEIKFIRTVNGPYLYRNQVTDNGKYDTQF